MVILTKNKMDLTVSAVVVILHNISIVSNFKHSNINRL